MVRARSTPIARERQQKKSSRFVNHRDEDRDNTNEIAAVEMIRGAKFFFTPRLFTESRWPDYLGTSRMTMPSALATPSP